MVKKRSCGISENFINIKAMQIRLDGIKRPINCDRVNFTQA